MMMKRRKNTTPATNNSNTDTNTYLLLLLLLQHHQLLLMVHHRHRDLPHQGGRARCPSPRPIVVGLEFRSQRIVDVRHTSIRDRIEVGLLANRTASREQIVAAGDGARHGFIGALGAEQRAAARRDSAVRGDASAHFALGESDVAARQVADFGGKGEWDDGLEVDVERLELLFDLLFEFELCGGGIC